jgi:hypothetical protein
MTDTAYTEILALRRRLARIEEMATAAAPPVDNPATIGDALETLRRTGSASGSAIDRLREAVEGPRTPAAAPDRAELAEATRRVVGGMAGSSTFEGALATMRANATRRDAIETVSPGSSGRIDVLSPGAAGPIDKIRKALSEGH